VHELNPLESSAAEVCILFHELTSKIKAGLIVTANGIMAHLASFGCLRTSRMGAQWFAGSDHCGSADIQFVTGRFHTLHHHNRAICDCCSIHNLRVLDQIQGSVWPQMFLPELRHQTYTIGSCLLCLFVNMFINRFLIGLGEMPGF
jgi:hypothetical protein